MSNNSINLNCPFCGCSAIYEVTEPDNIVEQVPALFCNGCKMIFKVENDSPYLKDNDTFCYLKEKLHKQFNSRCGLSSIKQLGSTVTLPISVGEILYTNLSMQGWYFKVKDAPYKVIVKFIGLNDGSGDDGGGIFNVEYELRGYMLQFNFSDIGKRIFFTREEAELHK